MIAQDARERARTTIQSLRTLIDSLPPSQTPKILVLISEGLVVDRESTQLAWLDARAAAAHVTIFPLHLEGSRFDASQRGLQAQPAADRTLQEQGLDRLATATRGDVFRIMSNSDFAFQRLALELSGYYLLGFEPESGGPRGGHMPSPSTSGVKRRDRPVAAAVLDGRRRAAAHSGARNRARRFAIRCRRRRFPIKLAAYSFRDPQSRKAAAAHRRRNRSLDQSRRRALGWLRRRRLRRQADREPDGHAAARQRRAAKD